MRAQQGEKETKETKGTCPMTCSSQVPKVTKALLASQDPQALQVPQDLLEADELKALGSQTCSMASVQVRHV